MTESNVKREISANFPKKIDYLLLSASFEDRCLSMFESLDPTIVSKTFIFQVGQFKESSSKNLLLLENRFNSKTFVVDHDQPITIADSITSIFSDLSRSSDKSNVVVDISTFTRESLLVVIKYLLMRSDEFSEIILFYRFAIVSDNLSDGIVSMRSVLGYLGDISVSKPTHLVLLSGFEHERAREIIDSLEPDFLSVGYGGEQNSIREELHLLNKEFTEKLLAYYSNESVALFEHSLRDPVEIKNMLLELAHKKPGYNTVISPLNNKISTIGAALAAFEDKSIQLIYAQMAQYNCSSYSRCEDDCIILDLKRVIETT